MSVDVVKVERMLISKCKLARLRWTCIVTVTCISLSSCLSAPDPRLTEKNERLKSEAQLALKKESLDTKILVETQRGEVVYLYGKVTDSSTKDYAELIVRNIPSIARSIPSIQVFNYIQVVDPIKQALEDAVKQLPEGQLELFITDSMTQGQREKAQARIIFNRDDLRQFEGKITSTIQSDIMPDRANKPNSPNAHRKVAERIKVGDVMKLDLVPANPQAFTIISISESEQVVTGKTFAEWNWEILPEESGNQRLYLRVAIKLAIPERGEKTYEAVVRERAIDVRVNGMYATKRFIKVNWQWLGTAILIPLIVWIYKILSAKNGATNSNAAKTHVPEASKWPPASPRPRRSGDRARRRKGDRKRKP